MFTSLLYIHLKPNVCMYVLFLYFVPESDTVMVPLCKKVFPAPWVSAALGPAAGSALYRLFDAETITLRTLGYLRLGATSGDHSVQRKHMEIV